MLISTTAKVKWNSRNKKHYTECGYEFTKMGDEFEVKIDDLTCGSCGIVTVKCDYCGAEYDLAWQTYVYTKKKSPIKTDCCSSIDCCKKKIEEVFLLKYGVTNVLKLDTIRDKIKKTFLDKYGTENPFASEIIKERIKITNTEKYGVASAMQLPEVVEKSRRTCMERYGVPNYSQTEKFRQSFSGENSPAWKGDDVIHGRVERFDPQYRQWRRAVYIRDAYTCQCCGARNKVGNGGTVQLHAHHIKNWIDNQEDRFDVDNGITLCSECHYAFHSKYGKHNNTQEQLDEFILTRTNPEKIEDKEIC